MEAKKSLIEKKNKEKVLKIILLSKTKKRECFN
jgi:hypothetical protein